MKREWIGGRIGRGRNNGGAERRREKEWSEVSKSFIYN